MRFAFTLIYNTLKSFDVFEGLCNSQLTEMSFLTKEITVGPNSVLVSDNEDLNFIYILVKGELLVTKTVENARSSKFMLVDSKLVKAANVSKSKEKFTEIIIAKLYAFDIVGSLNLKSMKFCIKTGAIPAVVLKIPLRYIKSQDSSTIKYLTFYLAQKDRSFQAFQNKQADVREVLFNQKLEHKRSRSDHNLDRKFRIKVASSPNNLRLDSIKHKMAQTPDGKYEALIRENSFMHKNIVEKVKNRNLVQRPNVIEIKSSITKIDKMVKRYDFLKKIFNKTRMMLRAGNTENKDNTKANITCN